MKIPNILIAVPVRNRDWILCKYLEHLYEIDYPKKNIGFHFILNDSIDNSKKMLYLWKQSNDHKYRYIRISELTLDYPNDIGESGNGRNSTNSNMINVRKSHTYKSLSVLRNLQLDLSDLDIDCNYLLSIDSDILVEPDIINRLLQTKLNIIASLISNGTNCYNFLPLGDVSRKILPSNEVFEVKVTGAVMLVSKKVFSNKNIRYSPMSSGEDAGFCESARRNGFKSYVLNYMQKHIMNKNDLKDVD
jgi:cellulose synthase/poly-beta-1,6-N-acetylglucosamine synthase-like glycosyltransferase